MVVVLKRSGWAVMSSDRKGQDRTGSPIAARQLCCSDALHSPLQALPNWAPGERVSVSGPKLVTTTTCLRRGSPTVPNYYPSTVAPPPPHPPLNSTLAHCLSSPPPHGWHSRHLLPLSRELLPVNAAAKSPRPRHRPDTSFRHGTAESAVGPAGPHRPRTAVKVSAHAP